MLKRCAVPVNMKWAAPFVSGVSQRWPAAKPTTHTGEST